MLKKLRLNYRLRLRLCRKKSSSYATQKMKKKFTAKKKPWCNYCWLKFNDIKQYQLHRKTLHPNLATKPSIIVNPTTTTNERRVGERRYGKFMDGERRNDERTDGERRDGGRRVGVRRGGERGDEHV